MTDPHRMRTRVATADRRAPQVLVVEDDDDVRRVVARSLVQSGYGVLEAATMSHGLRILHGDDEIDLAIIDLILPDGDGLDLLTEIRDCGDLPVIALSARGGESDTILGLEVGADDYVSKPFSPRELVARVGAILRRGAERSTETPELTYGDLSIDPASRSVWISGREVELTRMEFDLLWALASRPRKVCSRAELLRWVWNAPGDLDTTTVTEHVRRLRQKIEGGDDHQWVVTLRGVGYRFEPPGEGESRR